MTVPRVLLCFWLLAGLAGCDSEQPEPPRQPPAAAEAPQAPEQAASKVAESAAPATEVVPVAPRQPKPAISPKPATPPTPITPASPPPQTEPAAPAEPEAPEKPLDLSLPSEVAERFRLPSDEASLAVEAVEQPPALLPPLFEAHETEQSSFELGGRLITSEHPQSEDEGYLDSVEGAELQLRFRR